MGPRRQRHFWITLVAQPITGFDESEARVNTMDLDAKLLLLAFHHRLEEADFESGLRRAAEILGQSIKPQRFANAIDRALSSGHIHDPVQLRSGALQCCWHLRLTPLGVTQARQLLDSTTELTTD